MDLEPHHPLYQCDQWAADLRDQILTPQQFKTYTGIDLQKADEQRQAVRRRRQRPPWQRPLWVLAQGLGQGLLFFLLLWGLFMAAGLAIAALVWLVTHLLAGWWGLTPTFALALTVKLATGLSILGAIFIGASVGWEDYQAQRTWGSLFSLMDEMDRYHRLLKMMHVQDVADAGAGSLPQGRAALLEQVQSLRPTLVKALQVERLFREDPLLQPPDPVALALDVTDSPSAALLQTAQSYQTLLQQTLEIRDAIETEMNRL